MENDLHTLNECATKVGIKRQTLERCLNEAGEFGEYIKKPNGEISKRLYFSLSKCQSIMADGRLMTKRSKATLEQHEEKLRGIKVRNDKVAYELNFQKELNEKKYMLRTESIRQLNIIIQVTKTKLLAVPKRTCQRLALCNDPNRCDQIVYDEIVSSLTELSEYEFKE
jgi:hypothetical protein